MDDTVYINRGGGGVVGFTWRPDLVEYVGEHWSFADPNSFANEASLRLFLYSAMLMTVKESEDIQGVMTEVDSGENTMAWMYFTLSMLEDVGCVTRCDPGDEGVDAIGR